MYGNADAFSQHNFSHSDLFSAIKKICVSYSRDTHTHTHHLPFCYRCQKIIKCIDKIACFWNRNWIEIVHKLFANIKKIASEKNIIQLPPPPSSPPPTAASQSYNGYMEGGGEGDASVWQLREYFVCARAFNLWIAYVHVFSKISIYRFHLRCSFKDDRKKDISK